MIEFSSLCFDNSYARLPAPLFHSRVAPTPLAGCHMLSVNTALADLLQVRSDWLSSAEAVAQINGQRPLPGADPVAMRYAGHQFGHYVPQLGDGRAIVLGELRGESDRHWELQVKGAGPTPYSRDGDGRAVLRSTIREYLCCEAMHALGIPTTRALCLLGSREEVYRERIESAAVLLRVSPSHVRFGSFELFYYAQAYPALRQLADYVIEHDFPHLREARHPYLALLTEVTARTAGLMAQWQLVGFAHGVMNTDNMSILGLTLDYGPFGFMEAYEPGLICNHSDYHGRYAFDQQPSVGLWNLTCLAQAMLPLFDADDGEAAAAQAGEVLEGYEEILVQAYARGMRAKLGLQEVRAEDQALSARLLDLMAADRVDYSNLFRDLGEISRDGAGSDSGVRDRFVDRPAIDAWIADYRRRLALESRCDAARRAAMQQVNPRYILRNYLAQQAIDQAETGDYGEVERLLRILRRPFEEQSGCATYSAEPPDWGRRLVVSCSS